MAPVIQPSLMNTIAFIPRWFSHLGVVVTILILPLWIRSCHTIDLVFVNICVSGNGPWHSWGIQLGSHGGGATLLMTHDTVGNKHDIRNSFRVRISPFYDNLSAPDFATRNTATAQATVHGVRFPYWFTILLALAPATMRAVAPARAWLRWIYTPPSESRCPQCGYDLRASADRCPECGRPFDPSDGRTLAPFPSRQDLRRHVLQSFGCFLILLPIVAVPPLAGVLSLQPEPLEQEWSAEQPHLLAMQQRRHCEVVVAPLDMWDSWLLPSDLASYSKRTTSLAFYRTVITDADVEHMRACKSLRELALIVEIPDEGFPWLADMKRLRKLRLSGTQTTDAHLAYLRNLTDLRELYLDRMLITNVGIKQLGSLTNLRVLDLETTHITDEGLAHLQDLSNLEDLNLASTRITGAGLQHLISLVRLQRLSLSMTELTDDGWRYLKSMAQLRSLNVSSTHVTDEGLLYLKGMTQLRTLDLSSTRITDGGLQHVANLRGLEVLKIMGCPFITPDGVRQLRAALPKLQLDIPEPPPRPGKKTGQGSIPR